MLHESFTSLWVGAPQDASLAWGQMALQAPHLLYVGFSLEESVDAADALKSECNTSTQGYPLTL